MYIRNGQPFDIFKLQVINGNQYPEGYFYNAPERSAFDIHEVMTPVEPVHTDAQKATLTGFILNSGVWEPQWVLTAKTQGELDSDAAILSSAKALFISNTVDAEADAILERVIGARATEYLEAEAEAKAYKDANYSGTVPGGLQDWANIKGWTAHAAADNILDTASQWRLAQKAIRKARLTAKESARTAATTVQLEAAKTAWTNFQAYIRTQLGI